MPERRDKAGPAMESIQSYKYAGWQARAPVSEKSDTSCPAGDSPSALKARPESGIFPVGCPPVTTLRLPQSATRRVVMLTRLAISRSCGPSDG